MYIHMYMQYIHMYMQYIQMYMYMNMYIVLSQIRFSSSYGFVGLCKCTHVHVQCACTVYVKKTFHTVGNKRRLNGSVV